MSGIESWLVDTRSKVRDREGDHAVRARSRGEGRWAMNRSYEDITSRLGPPLWWDDNGVPRYEPFGPRLCDVYAQEVVLEEIACQACGRRFNVACERLLYDLSTTDPRTKPWTEPPHYGDPPNDRCCPAGPTMNVDFVRVLEWWRYERGDWRRVGPDEVRFELEPEGEPEAFGTAYEQAKRELARKDGGQ